MDPALPAPAVPAASHAAVLPTDVLVLVFSYVPLRPLFAVVRRVCRRWRDLAPLSVRTLPALPRTERSGLSALYNMPSLLRTFVNVTSWHVPIIAKGDVSVNAALSVGVAPWIGRLRALTIESGEPDYLLPAISQLTSLTCYAPSHCCSKAFEAFVASNAATLAQLKISYSYKGVFPAAPLPALRSLYLPGGGWYADHYNLSPRLLARYASALTALEMPAPPKELFALHAPHLRTLTLGDRLHLSDALNMGSADVQHWFQGLSALTTAALSFDGPLAPLAACRPHALTALYVRHPATPELAEEALPALALCTQLRTLGFRAEPSLKTRHFQGIQRRLLSVVGPRLHALVNALLPGPELHDLCPALTSLTFRETALPADYLLSLRLPHLRELVLDTRHSSSPGTTGAGLLHALTAMPTLRTLWLCLNNATLPLQIDAAPLEEALRTAERNGMERVTVSPARSHPSPDTLLSVWSRLAPTLQWLTLSPIKVN